MPKTTCTIDGCDRPHLARGWCATHYQRWRTHGDPHHVRTQAPLERCIKRGPGCWPWQGTISDQGYGLWWVPETRRHVRAHRKVYELEVGPIPDDLTLDHECHNRDLTCAGGPTCRHRACVRPDHLVSRTQRDNNFRGRSPSAANSAKTHCPHGHPYDEANTYVSPSGTRFCRTCKRIQRGRDA